MPLLPAFALNFVFALPSPKAPVVVGAKVITKVKMRGALVSRKTIRSRTTATATAGGATTPRKNARPPCLVMSSAQHGATPPEVRTRIGKTNLLCEGG